MCSYIYIILFFLGKLSWKYRPYSICKNPGAVSMILGVIVGVTFMLLLWIWVDEQYSNLFVEMSPLP